MCFEGERQDEIMSYLPDRVFLAVHFVLSRFECIATARGLEQKQVAARKHEFAPQNTYQRPHRAWAYRTEPVTAATVNTFNPHGKLLAPETASCTLSFCCVLLLASGPDTFACNETHSMTLSYGRDEHM